MKPIKTFKIGSQVFFNDIPEYKSKDIDELCIMDTFIFNSNSIHINGLHGKDVFFYRQLDKQDWIKDVTESKLPMKIGKFLVPEFANYIGLTIDDLKNLKDIVDKIDEKHNYEKIIYDSYIENNGFYLTEEQKMKAFNKYKKNRN